MYVHIPLKHVAFRNATLTVFSVKQFKSYGPHFVTLVMCREGDSTATPTAGYVYLKVLFQIPKLIASNGETQTHTHTLSSSSCAKYLHTSVATDD